MKPEKPGPPVWKSPELARTFLAGVRGAIPLAGEQIKVILHLVRAWRPGFFSFLDLGCGDGILGRALLTLNPAADGAFADFNESMLTAARDACPPGSNCRFLSLDFGSPGWANALAEMRSFDIVVSGFAIHHQDDSRKKEIYADIFDLLAPGGLFLHLEHVSSPTDEVRLAADNYFIDSLCEFHSRAGGAANRKSVAREFFNRPDKVANILAPLQEQIDWLRRAGFLDVDCYFKVFELAVFGGRKP